MSSGDLKCSVSHIQGGGWPTSLEIGIATLLIFLYCRLHLSSSSNLKDARRCSNFLKGDFFLQGQAKYLNGN